MIHGQLAERAAQLTADRVPFAVATLVRARAPTSVHPGDCALVLADGTIEGFVGGACASASVRLHGLRVLETGEPLLLRLLPGDDDPEAADGGGEAVVVERNPCLSGGALEIFLEPQLPAPRMLVIGEAPIARALERLALAAGYEVVRTNAEAAQPGPAEAAVVVASHGAGEERVLAQALTAGVPYVALVASRKRGDAVRDGLEIPEELKAQLHTPAGLELGASVPEEVAIAILAELVQARHSAPLAGRTPVASDSASATDPVCGMELPATDSSLHLDLPGGRVYFCSERCREAFAGSQQPDAAAR